MLFLFFLLLWLDKQYVFFWYLILIKSLSLKSFSCALFKACMYFSSNSHVFSTVQPHWGVIYRDACACVSLSTSVFRKWGVREASLSLCTSCLSLMKGDATESSWPVGPWSLMSHFRSSGLSWIWAVPAPGFSLASLHLPVMIRSLLSIPPRVSR